MCCTDVTLCHIREKNTVWKYLQTYYKSVLRKMCYMCLKQRNWGIVEGRQQRSLSNGLCPLGLPLAWLTTPNRTERYDFWAFNSRLVGQEILSLWRNLQVHCRVHNSPPLIPILNRRMQSTSFRHIYFKICTNTLFFLALRSKWCICTQFHVCFTHHASHPLWFCCLNDVWWWVLLSYTLRCSATSVCNFIQPSVGYGSQNQQVCFYRPCLIALIHRH